jgi:hypothetical protein
MYYIKYLDMFRAILGSSSGGQIVLLQHLVSSLFVSGRAVHRLRANCLYVYYTRWLHYSYTILFWRSYIDILVLLVLHQNNILICQIRLLHPENMNNITCVFHVKGRDGGSTVPL